MSITWEDPIGEKCEGRIRPSPAADKSGLLGIGGADINLDWVEELLRREFMRSDDPESIGEGERLGSSPSIGGGQTQGRGFKETGVWSPFASLKAQSSMVNSETCANTPTKSERVCREWMLATAISA